MELKEYSKVTIHYIKNTDNEVFCFSTAIGSWGKTAMLPSSVLPIVYAVTDEESKELDAILEKIKNDEDKTLFDK